MDVVPTPDLEATVTSGGDLLVPAHAVRALALRPGQRVHLRLAAPPRRNLRGALRNQLPHVTAEEISQLRKEIWGELADQE